MENSADNPPATPPIPLAETRGENGKHPRRFARETGAKRAPFRARIARGIGGKRAAVSRCRITFGSFLEKEKLFVEVSNYIWEFLQEGKPISRKTHRRTRRFRRVRRFVVQMAV